MTDYATNQRLDEAIAKLRDDLVETERILRDRDDEKEHGLRAEFVMAVRESESRTHGRLDDLDEHLNRQDEVLQARAEVWPAFWRTAFLLAMATIVASLTLHYGFHVG